MSILGGIHIVVSVGIACLPSFVIQPQRRQATGLGEDEVLISKCHQCLLFPSAFFYLIGRLYLEMELVKIFSPPISMRL